MILEKYKSHHMDDNAVMTSNVVKSKASDLDEVISKVTDCREKSLALTKLEECVMWANKAIALYGLK